MADQARVEKLKGGSRGRLIQPGDEDIAGSFNRLLTPSS